MQSTTVDVSGKGTNKKTTLYVGGLEESVTEALLNQVFQPFGDVKDVNIPLDNTTGAHRGFGFIEFEEKDDASQAIDNMHHSELLGKVLKVNYAQPMKIKGGSKGWSHQAVWADADGYMDVQLAEKEAQQIEKQQRLDEKQRKESSKAAGAQPDPNDPMAQLEQQAELQT